MKGLNLSKMLVMLLLTVSFNVTFAQSGTELSPDDKRELADSIKMLEDCEETVKEKDQEILEANKSLKRSRELNESRGLELSQKDADLAKTRDQLTKQENKTSKRTGLAAVGWGLALILILL